jgi:hypothetical protein
MNLDKNEQFAELNGKRHTRDMKLDTDHHTREDIEKKSNLEKRDKEEALYQSMTEL